MKRLQSRKDCKGYTLMKQLLINLELESSDYNWLITDIEAYPQSKEIFEIIDDKEYIILSTKELMNILLTRSVNGYQFPWWVFFVGAMNPSTLNSVYATNEMDPAQLDRFIKIKVGDNTNEWLKYGKTANISPSILTFIKDNPKCLSADSKELNDEEKQEVQEFVKKSVNLENLLG